MNLITSTFLKLEGNTVRNRIWNFLVVHSEFDYSMKDIARYADVSYTALKEIWKIFIKRKIVVNTRNIGKAKMYKLNVQNPIIKKFIEYYWKIIEEETQEKPKADYTAQAVGVASAQHL